jgi:hypothetical protein
MNKLSIDPLVFNSRANVDVLAAKAEQSGTDLLEFAKQLAQAANHSTKAPYAQFSVQRIGFDEGAPTKGIVDFAILHALMDKKEVAPPETEVVEQEAANDAGPASAVATRHTPAAKNDNDGATQGLSETSTIMFKESAPGSPPQIHTAGHNDHSETPRSAPRGKKIGVVDSNILDFSFAVTKNPHHIMTAACMLRTDTTLKQENGAPIYARSGRMGDIQDVDSMPGIANFLFSWVHDNIPEKDQPAFRENCKKLGLVGGEPSIGFTAQIA